METVFLVLFGIVLSLLLVIILLKAGFDIANYRAVAKQRKHK